MSVRLDLPAIRRRDDYAVTLRCWTTRDRTARRDLSDRTYAAAFQHVRDTDRTAFTVDTTNLASGLIVLRLTSVQTALLVLGLAEWDLQQTAAGARTTVFDGHVPIEGDITP